MEDIEMIWVEVETNAGGVSTSGYNGSVNYLDYENVMLGNHKAPFLKLSNVHWYKWPDDEDDWQGKKLVEYGKGEYTEYAGEMVIRIDTIVIIQRLQHGPKDLSL